LPVGLESPAVQSNGPFPEPQVRRIVRRAGGDAIDYDPR
jgi:hypothetical protein